jgi:beta-propeller uncharacterized protein DUF5122
MIVLPDVNIRVPGRLLAAAAAVLTALAGGITPATADLAQPTVVSENPVDYTPHVLDGTVWAMAVVGNTVVVGGSFTSVADSSRRHTFSRHDIFAFDLRDGTIRSFAPQVDGPVYALAAGPGDTVYAGGAFTTVNGTSSRGLARLSLSGARLGSFSARINKGDVRTLAVRSGWLYAGGTFTGVNGVARAGLARLDDRSGGLDGRFDAQFSAPGLIRTYVEDVDISPDGRQMVVVGSLLRSGSTNRSRIAMFDITGPTAALTGWYTDAYAPPCAPDFQAYLRQVKFSPDGSYLVVAATGGTSDPDKLCDAAARFDTAGSGPHNPVWVQHTGGNSLFAVAVTGAAVYLGGHQLYLDNPYGHKIKNPGQPPVFTPGPGAVLRPGIGAVDPATGRALPWNPTRTRGVGVRVFVAVPQGLLVGSDTDELGHEYHGRIGMFPL